MKSPCYVKITTFIITENGLAKLQSIGKITAIVEIFTEDPLLCSYLLYDVFIISYEYKFLPAFIKLAAKSFPI